MIRLLPILVLLSGCLSLTASYAQTARVFGIVTDAESGETLISATVEAGGQGALTDYNGAFSLDLAPGTYPLTIRYVGYRTYSDTVSLAAGEERELTLTLEPANTMLQTATVTSGRYEKPLSDVTVSLEVIRPQLVENTNATSVTTVLDKVPGVSMIDGQANIRGGSGYSYGAGSRVLLLVDDIPILQSDAGRPNWRDVPVENLEQIEVVKGAASALYGSSALNGIINVRTGFARAEPETHIATFGTISLTPGVASAKWWDSPPYEFGGSVRHARRIGKLDLVLSSYYFNQESFAQGNFDRYGRLLTNLRYRLTDRLSIGLNVNYNEGDGRSFFYWAGIDSLFYRPAPGTVSNQNPRRYNIDPYVTYFDNWGNRHRLLGRYYNVANRNDNNQSNFSKLYYAEYQFLRRWQGSGLVMTAGAVATGTAIEAELYGDTVYRSRNYAGYLQFDKEIGDRLNLSAGMRYEYNALYSPVFVGGDTIPEGKTTESKPVFRLGANYQAAEYTFLRASWGQGYRYPTVAEKFIQTFFGAVPIRPNPDLESETGWSAEFGIKQGFRLAGFSGFADVSAFWSEYDDMLEFNVPFNAGIAFQSQNVGGTRIRGLELSLAGQGSLAGKPTTLLAGYTYIDPQFRDYDTPPADPRAPRTVGQRNAELSSADYNVLKYRFRHTGKLDVETQFGRFSVGLAGLYNSRMEAIDRIFLLFIPGLAEWRERETDVFLFNARAAYRFGKHVKLSVLGSNLFNKVYTVRPGQLEGPRSVGLRLDVKL